MDIKPLVSSVISSYSAPWLHNTTDSNIHRLHVIHQLRNEHAPDSFLPDWIIEPLQVRISVKSQVLLVDVAITDATLCRCTLLIVSR